MNDNLPEDDVVEANKFVSVPVELGFEWNNMGLKLHLTLAVMLVHNEHNVLREAQHELLGLTGLIATNNGVPSNTMAQFRAIAEILRSLLELFEECTKVMQIRMTCGGQRDKYFAAADQLCLVGAGDKVTNVAVHHNVKTIMEDAILVDIREGDDFHLTVLFREVDIHIDNRD